MSKAEFLASYRGRETEAKAFGQAWRFSRWDINVIDDMTAWGSGQLPDPIEAAEKAVLRLQRQARKIREDQSIPDDERAFLLAANDEQQERITRVAMEEATTYLAYNSPKFRSLLNHPRGVAHLFALLLKKHHPEVTDDFAFELVRTLGDEEVARVMNITAGKGPGAPAGNG